MKRVGLGLALLCLVCGGVTASAQDKYPSRPVKVVVPYAPGGASDITARLFGEQEIEAKPGSVVYIPANVVHSGEATPEEDVVFFTCKDASHSLHGVKAA